SVPSMPVRASARMRRAPSASSVRCSLMEPVSFDFLPFFVLRKVRRRGHILPILRQVPIPRHNKPTFGRPRFPGQGWVFEEKDSSMPTIALVDDDRNILASVSIAL